MQRVQRSKYVDTAITAVSVGPLVSVTHVIENLDSLRNGFDTFSLIGTSALLRSLCIRFEFLPGIPAGPNGSPLAKYFSSALRLVLVLDTQATTVDITYAWTDVFNSETLFSLPVFANHERFRILSDEVIQLPPVAPYFVLDSVDQTTGVATGDTFFTTSNLHHTLEYSPDTMYRALRTYQSDDFHVHRHPPIGKRMFCMILSPHVNVGVNGYARLQFEDY